MNENADFTNHGKNLENNESFEEVYNKELEEWLILARDFNSTFHNDTIEDNIKKGKFLDKKISERIQLLKKNGIKNIEEITEIKFYDEELKPRIGRGGSLKENEFFQEALSLIKLLGYDGELKNQWLKLRKGDKDFTILYSAFPGRDDIYLRRIKALGARKNEKKIANYMYSWLQACEDQETQKEIDQIIAVLR